VTQAGVVARLAVRELWISFRLFAVVAAFTAAGAFVALVPAPLPETAGRLAAGLGAATLVAAGAAAWSMAEERRSGRAGWLVSRSVPRPTLLAGWFLAFAGTSLVGLLAAGILGWLAAAGVTLRLEPDGYVALVAGVAAAVLAAVGLGLLVGTLLPPRPAVLVTLALCALAGMVSWLAPLEPTLVPGGAHVALAGLTEPGGSAGPGLRAAGIGLATAAAVLVLARAAIERAEL
jgi:hypothetical protein